MPGPCDQSKAGASLGGQRTRASLGHQCIVTDSLCSESVISGFSGDIFRFAVFAIFAPLRENALSFWLRQAVVAAAKLMGDFQDRNAKFSPRTCILRALILAIPRNK